MSTFLWPALKLQQTWFTLLRPVHFCFPLRPWTCSSQRHSQALFLEISGKPVRLIDLRLGFASQVRRKVGENISCQWLWDSSHIPKLRKSNEQFEFFLTRKKLWSIVEDRHWKSSGCWKSTTELEVVESLRLGNTLGLRYMNCVLIFGGMPGPKKYMEQTPYLVTISYSLVVTSLYNDPQQSFPLAVYPLVWLVPFHIVQGWSLWLIGYGKWECVSSKVRLWNICGFILVSPLPSVLFLYR